MFRWFKKGINLTNFKARSLLSPKIHRVVPPRFLFYSLSEDVSNPLVPCIEAGMRVFVGTKIADGLLPIHSSASGHVTEVSDSNIRIESDEALSPDPSIEMRHEIPSETEALLNIVR